MVFWLTAASNGVYKFVCLKQTKTTVDVALTPEEIEHQIQQELENPSDAPPKMTKEVSVMRFFNVVCCGIPILLVGGMLIPDSGGEPTFSFQPLSSTGWCGINMDAPMRSFTLFYLPLIGCMFYQSSAYFFCMKEVQLHGEQAGKIDAEVIYDPKAALTKKKSAAKFAQNQRATGVLRLSLVGTSLCWTPPCMFSVLLIGTSLGVIGNDPESLKSLAHMRVFCAFLNPANGFILACIIEKAFNLSSRYNTSVMRNLRKLRFKLCGPPARRTMVLDDTDEFGDEKDNNIKGGCVYQIQEFGWFLWEMTQLFAFAPWALAVWIPMDTFQTEVSSNDQLVKISVAYLLMLIIPVFVLLILMPLFYAQMDEILAGDVTDGDSVKGNIASVVGAAFFIYVSTVLTLFRWSIRNKLSKGAVLGMKNCVFPLFVYMAFIIGPVLIVMHFFGDVWVFFDNVGKVAPDEQHGIDIKHHATMGFIYFYIAACMGITVGAMYNSRRRHDLNHVAEPRSHADWNPINIKVLLLQLCEGIQYCSLILTHTMFAGDFHGDSFGGEGRAHFDGLIANNTQEGWSSENHTVEDTLNAMYDELDGKVALLHAERTTLDFGFTKIFLFDISVFSGGTFVEYADTAFQLKLWGALLMVTTYVSLVVIPLTMSNIREDESRLFGYIFAQSEIIQDALSGPLFLVIVQTFLSTVDCVHDASGEGTWNLELKPSQVCWEGEHLLYAMLGMTGLMAYIPLACLNVEFVDDLKNDFRYTPLYMRLQIMSKALMAVAVQFTNHLDPIYSLPIVCGIAVYMVYCVRLMRPCCIVWANQIQLLLFHNTIWTAGWGIGVYYFYKEAYKTTDLDGVPLPLVGILFLGWLVILVYDLLQVRNDRILLRRPSTKLREGPVTAWSDYLDETPTKRDSVQSSRLNSMRLAKRPDDTDVQYHTHQEVLTPMFMLRSNASAGTKQRALQILSAVTGSSSSHIALNEMEEAAIHADADDGWIVDHEGEAEIHAFVGGMKNIEANAHAISAQTRRRLLGYSGEDGDLDDGDWHFPDVVYVSPVGLIDILAEEFDIVMRRDDAANDKKESVFQIVEEEEEEGDERSLFARLFIKTAQQEAWKSDVERKTAEILYLLKRQRDIINDDVITNFSAELPQQFLINSLLSHIKTHPPDVLRLKVSGGGTQVTMGEGELQDDHLLQHILELPEDKIFGGVDAMEVESLTKVRMIRRMHASMAVHLVLEKIQGLPAETLDREDNAFDDLDVPSDEGITANCEEKRHHELSKKIRRLEQEKEILDREIQENRDIAISDVAKVYLVRIIAVYSEYPTFCKRVIDRVGADLIIDFLMHGDHHLQLASTVAIFQLAKCDPGVLDTLEHHDGAMVFVATKLTHPAENGIITHRIAADLLVEISKRVELRAAMVGAGLVGPLLRLVTAYCLMLRKVKDESGKLIRYRIEGAVQLFRASHQSEDGSKAKTSESRVGNKVLIDTNEMAKWCPFELKGPDPHGLHVLLSFMRVFQQLSDEDSFRSEFVGRHKGLQWLRDQCWTINDDDVKLMCMRVLLGLSVEPFGFYDIVEDPKMLKFYIEMMEFKDGENVDIGDVMPMHSRDEMLRMKMHRVAEFVRLDHKNATEISERSGHPVRYVNMTLMSEEDENKRFHEHNQSLLEIVRERIIDETFVMVSQAAGHHNEAIREAGIMVLCTLCYKCAHLPDDMYSMVFERMLELRQHAIDVKDVVTYEEVVGSAIRMAHNHRVALKEVHMKTADDVFTQLWLYQHLLHKDLSIVVKSPFWNKVRGCLDKESIKLVKLSQNTAASQSETRQAFRDLIQVVAFFKMDAPDYAAEEAEERSHWACDLNVCLRKKINAAVKKAIVLSRKLGMHYEAEEDEKDAVALLLGPELASKEAHDALMQTEVDKLDEKIADELEINLAPFRADPDARKGGTKARNPPLGTEIQNPMALNEPDSPAAGADAAVTIGHKTGDLERMEIHEHPKAKAKRIAKEEAAAKKMEEKAAKGDKKGGNRKADKKAEAKAADEQQRKERQDKFLAADKKKGKKKSKKKEIVVQANPLLDAEEPTALLAEEPTESPEVPLEAPTESPEVLAMEAEYAALQRANAAKAGNAESQLLGDLFVQPSTPAKPAAANLLLAGNADPAVLANIEKASVPAPAAAPAKSAYVPKPGESGHKPAPPVEAPKPKPQLPDVVLAVFEQAKAKEADGDLAGALALYQNGIKKATGHIKVNPESKKDLTPALKQVLQRAQKLKKDVAAKTAAAAVTGDDSVD